MEVVINFWAVFGAAVAGIILGALWYGPLFGKQWMRIVGLTKEDMEEAKSSKSAQNAMMRSYAIMAVGTLVMAYVLANVIAVFNYAFDGGIGNVGMTAGIWMWVGFIAPAMVGHVIWEGRPWKYWFITAGYYLVSLMLMGTIIATAS